MCTGHDDVVGRDTVARLSRRGFLRTAATTAAVVGTSSALAGPALAQEEASRQARGRHRVHSKEAGVVEYIVERDDAGTPPRQPADALDTARVGYQFLRTIRF